MSKIGKFVFFLLLAIFAFYFSNGEALAQCPAGQACMGTTVVDDEKGCEIDDIGGNQVCTQAYGSLGIQVSCDSSCGYSQYDDICLGGTPPNCISELRLERGSCCGNGGGGGGGGTTGEPCSSNSDCSSGRCSQRRGICVDPPDSSGNECNLGYVNCPPGTIRGSTVVGSQCANSNCTAGTAQVQGDCCRDVVIAPSTCSDWYDCPTRNNPNKVCRDCTDEETMCIQYTFTQYNCVSVCTATAPTNVVVTPISLTSAQVTWTPGNTNIGQAIYVSTSSLLMETQGL